MPSHCVACGTDLPQVAYFCPACGNPSEAESGVPKPRWADRWLAVFAYFTFFPAIALILLPPWKKNFYVRFHSYQSIFFSLACLILSLALRLLDVVFSLLPRGLLIIFLTWGIAAIVAGLLWLILVLKALLGQYFSLPVLGRVAAKTSRPDSQPNRRFRLL